jgi:PAS domain S-box-containing protein
VNINFDNNDLIEANSQLLYGLVENSLFSNFNIACAFQAQFCVNDAGQFTYTNNAMSCLTEYSCDELLNMTLFEVDTSVSHNWTEIWENLKNNHSIAFFSSYLTKTNRTIPVEVSISYVEKNGIEFGCTFVSQRISQSCLSDFV